MIRDFLIVFIIMGIIDMSFLSLIVDYVWKDMIKDIQISPFKPNLKFILIPYLLITLAIVIFVLPNIKTQSIMKDSLIYGGLLGLIIYGVFDSTNLILFTRYNISTSIIDTLWGITLFTIVTFLSKKTLLYFKDLV
jgi:uncharacterized membrane protein